MTRDKMSAAYRINKWLVVLIYKELLQTNKKTPKEKLANVFIHFFNRYLLCTQ